MNPIEERGTESEYLVIAVNKVCEGGPSNPVMAVLWRRTI